MHLEWLRAVGRADLPHPALGQDFTPERYPGFTFSSPDNLAKQILSGAILDLLSRESITAATILPHLARNPEIFADYSLRGQDRMQQLPPLFRARVPDRDAGGSAFGLSIGVARLKS